MIARRWCGRVPLLQAKAFAEHLRATGVKDYHAQPGCEAIQLLRRDEAEWATFELTSIWTGMAAIEAYAGPAATNAVLYPDDEQFDLVPDLVTSHFAVLPVCCPRRTCKPVIDRRFAFEQLPAALARLDDGPFGKIVIDMT